MGPRRSVTACVHNVGTETKRNVGIQVRALEHPVSHLTPVALPPTVLTEHKWKVAQRLAPAAGVVARGTLELADDWAAAKAFEAHANRFDLLD